MHFRITPYSIIKWTLFWSIFFGTALFLILWASGYRYDFKNKVVVSTGILVIKTYPKQDVEIFIDNKKQTTNKTPLKLSLFPKEYNVLIKKQGYSDWEKTIKISSKKSLFLDNIVLFKENVDKNVLESNVLLYAESNDKKNIVYSKNENEEESLYLLNQDGEKSKLYPKENQEKFTEKLVSLNFNGNNLCILSFENSKYILNISNNKFTKINTAPFPLSYFFINENEYFAILEKNLIKYNINTKEIKVIEPSVESFSVNNGSLVYLATNNNKQVLKKGGLSGGGDVVYEFLGNVDFSESKIIFTPEIDYYGLIDKNNDLYFINTTEKSIKTLGSNIKEAFFTEDEKRFVYFNEHEISEVILKKEGQLVNEDLTINRSSESLNFINFLNETAEMQHLVYVKNNELFVADDDGKNETKLSGSVSKAFFSKKDPLKLYFIDDQKNIVSIFYKDNESILEMLNFRD